MKKSRAVISIGMMVLLFAALSFANENNPSGRSASLPKAAAAMGPAATVLNINNLMIWVDRDGFFPWTHTYAASWAAEYPKGTAGLIFAEGLLWGARVDDAGTRDGTKPRIRVNGATYATGLKAGKVLYDANGNVTGADETPTDRHVWRVRADYQTADLTSDASTFYSIALDDISDADIDSIYVQYDRDWQNWPAGDGAPYQERNGSAGYQAAVWDVVNNEYDNGDFPGEPGASQTIWLVANDLPFDNGSEVAPNSYGSTATGMELQLTMWAYQFGSNHPLNNAILKRARMIYTGLPDTARLDSMYIVQWSDPDLGTYTNDYVGCDIDLSLGYVYNGHPTDNTYLGDFGLPVPAAGYQLLKGPIAGGDTLGMTSFGYFGNDFPNIGSYYGTRTWWNCMEGFFPHLSRQIPWTDPITGEPTKYPLSGDPVTGSGWIDGIIL
ncbi:MAG: hypothetical protein IIA60_14000, partial [Candidatus Marinimicrobia bacterium]|nr:hypothetical protein [Candidatus Neomarinimicrobiota bacterium]